MKAKNPVKGTFKNGGMLSDRRKQSVILIISRRQMMSLIGTTTATATATIHRGDTEMATDTVINAAKAIYENRNGARCKPWSQLPASHQSPYLDDAEAARKSFLAALQEPTPAMQLVVSANWGRRTWAEYQQVLNASALGEQSE
jgi:hypothetical protein